MERPMRPLLPMSARPLADYFSRAVTSFQNSSSKLQIVCTTSPALHHGGTQTPECRLPMPVPPRTRPRALIVLDSSFNPPTRAHCRMATSAVHDLAVRKVLGLGALRLLLLLSVNNADKAAKPAAFDRRLAMMWAFAADMQHSLQGEVGHAAEEEDKEELLNVDIGLSMLPYFHEKSAAISELDFYRGEGGSDDTGEMQQVFLVGYDTLIRIFNPKYYGRPAESTAGLASAGATPMQKALGPFFARATLRVTMRTGDEWGEQEEQMAFLEGLLKADGLDKVGGSKDWGGRIEMVEAGEAGGYRISSTHARAAARAQDWGSLDRMVTPEVRCLIEQEALYAG